MILTSVVISLAYRQNSSCTLGELGLMNLPLSSTDQRTAFRQGKKLPFSGHDLNLLNRQRQHLHLASSKRAFQGPMFITIHSMVHTKNAEDTFLLWPELPFIVVICHIFG